MHGAQGGAQVGGVTSTMHAAGGIRTLLDHEMHAVEGRPAQAGEWRMVKADGPQAQAEAGRG